MLHKGACNCNYYNTQQGKNTCYTSTVFTIYVIIFTGKTQKYRLFIFSGSILQYEKTLPHLHAQTPKLTMDDNWEFFFFLKNAQNGERVSEKVNAVRRN